MKAIIPAAGYGTRFFPVSKAVPKELLPVGDRPAIHLIVEEAIEAGAEEVIVITSPDKQLLAEYFRNDPVWHTRLAKKKGALAKLHHLEEISGRVIFVDQHEQLGLGHAVLQAAPLLEDETEPVLILLGDALVLGGEVAASTAMLEISKERNNASVIGLELVPPEKVSSYGIAAGKPDGSKDIYRLSDLVEKPSMEKTPSDMAVAGRYLLSPRIFTLLSTLEPGHGGEIQLTDAIAALLREEAVYGYLFTGTRCDIGNPEGYLKTLRLANRS